LAALAIVGSGWAATDPGHARTIPDASSRFTFRREQIASVAVDGYRTIRRVEPALARIDAWISGVGAAVALTDADGNGRADDACLVDPRTGTVTVSPVAGTGSRYRPFVLDARPLPYNRVTMAPTGCLPGDFNEDGATDFVVSYWGRSPVAFLRLPGRSLGS